MKKLMIYVCGHHDEGLALIPERPFLTRVNLNKLDIGEFQNNQLSESRIFLADLEPVEYIGFATASWSTKWAGLPAIFKINRILDLSPTVVWCASLEKLDGSHRKWFSKCDFLWPQMTPFLEEMARFSGLSLDIPNAPISNNFVCHWDVYQRFLKQWKEIFFHIYKKYPIDVVCKAMEFAPCLDPDRLYGYLCERISMLVLSNMDGVEFKEMKQNNPTILKLPLKVL